MLVRLGLFGAASAYGSLKRWRDNRCGTVYPASGLQSWFDQISRRLIAGGADIRLGSGVSKLAIDTRGKKDFPVSATLDGNGAGLMARRIYVTNAFDAGTLTLDGVSVPANREGRHTQHMTMLDH